MDDMDHGFALDDIYSIYMKLSKRRAGNSVRLSDIHEQEEM